MTIKALSLWQPWATLFAYGQKKIETRSWRLGKFPDDFQLVGAAGCARMASELPQDSLERAHQLCAVQPFQLVVHAAKRWTKEQKALCLEEPFFSALTHIVEEDMDLYFASVEASIALGCLIGVVEIFEFIPLMGSWHDLKELRLGDFSKGRWGWGARNFRPFTQPIPCCGAQGLFDVDVDEALLAGKAVAHG